MPLAQPPISSSQALGIYRVIGHNDEAQTSGTYSASVSEALHQVYDRSTFWQIKAKFVELERSLASTASLVEGWDHNGSEAPTDLARQLSMGILRVLEQSNLVPNHLGPSAEGGIGLTFVNGVKRAVIEIYNNGEMAAVTFSDYYSPEAWEFKADQNETLNTIQKVRVYLAS